MKLLLVLCAIWLALEIRRRLAVKRGAERLGDAMKVLQATEQEYASAEPRDFPFLDLDWYDTSTSALEDIGFRVAENKLDVGHNRRNPEASTFIRVLLSPDGATTVGLYHYKNRAPKVKKSLLRDLRISDMETEMSDGHFFATTNASANAKFDYGPLIHDQRVQLPAPIDVYRVHEQRLAEYLAANPGVQPRVLRTAEDARGLQQRLKRVKGEYRQGMKVPITEAELKRIDGGRHPETAEQLARAVEKVAEKGRR